MHATRTTVIAVLALTVTTAAAHGVVTCRWTGGRDETPAIPPIPNTIGEWVGSDDDTDIDEPHLAHLTRRYTHARTGRSMLVSLTVGHPGLTGVHTPEYCYRGSGYDQVGRTERRPAEVKGGPPAAFWTTQFQKKTPTGTEQLRIFWAWSAGQGWVAPSAPRWHFLGKPSLYKLYVVGGGQADVAPGRDPALDDFLATLLATLNQSLFAPPS
ncbi:MAG TPA: exosortase-associated EpsI family protein [Gemmataceae bacterium]